MGDFAKELLKKLWIESRGSLGQRFRFHTPYVCEGEGRKHSMLVVHGAPGSHNDWKYFRTPAQVHNFHLIAPNLPGLGLTQLDGQDFRQENGEMADFLASFMDSVAPKVSVVVGHSAGAFPAARLLAEAPERADLLVLVNPGGVRPHRAMRPMAGPLALSWLWTRLPWLRAALRPLLFLFFTRFVGLRVPDGDVGAACSLTVAGVDFDKQRELLGRLGLEAEKGVLILYGGSDPLIEADVAEELARTLNSAPTITHVADKDTIAKVEENLNSGLLHNTIAFPDDGHFCQKYRSELIVALAARYLSCIAKSSSKQEIVHIDDTNGNDQV